MESRKTPVLDDVANTWNSDSAGSMMTAALLAILLLFVFSSAQAQVVVQETFDDNLLRDPATTADWDTDPLETNLKLPTAGSLVPVQSLINSFLDTDTSSLVDATDLATTRAVVVGDLNGDGFPDLAFGNNGANSVYFNDGSGTFTRGSAIPDDANGNTRSAVIEDFDGDGHLDLLFAEFGSQDASRIYFNNGSGTMDVFTLGDFVDLGLPALRGDSVAAGDVDNDGDIDVVIGVLNDYVQLFRNDGFGNFSDPESVVDGDPSFGFHARTVLLGDLNRDGNLDLVAAREADSTRIYLNNGSGGFDAPQSAGGGGIDNSLSAPDSAFLGDVDGDGFLDLVVGNDGSGTVLGVAAANYLFLNSGLATVFPDPPTEFSDLANTNGGGLIDVDRDGDLDIVTADFVSGNGNEVPGPNRLYLNDGSGGFPATGTTITMDSTVSKGLASGDFDGDGALDLVYANETSATSSAENRIVLNAGTLSGTPADQLFATGLSLSSNVITIPAVGVVFQALTNETEANRVFRYWLSDDDGLNWIIVEPGRSIAFPSAVDNNLRWRAELNSLSTGLRPELAQILITRDGAPRFDSTEETTATEDVEYTYNIDTSDPDGSADLLDISTSVLPSWLTFTDNGDTTATLIGTPLDANVGTLGNDVTLEVVDGAGRLASQSFVIDVGNVNDPPTVPFPTADQLFDQGDAANIDMSIAFDDLDGDTLTYSATGLPASLTLNTVSGLITGTLTNDDVFAVPGGVYSVVVTADDGNLGTVDDSFSITVNNVNDAPTVVAPTGNQAFDQGTSVNLDTSMAFEDIDGDTLAYSATGLPASLTFDNATGVVTGTLTNDDVLAGPDYAIVVTATEVGTADLFSVDDSFTFRVNNLNDAPTVIAPTGNRVFDQGDAANLDTSLAFEDIDGDTLTYSATGLPASLAIDSVSGLITGTLTNDDVFAVPGGVHFVVVTADDGNTGTVQDNFTVTVNNINDAPTVVMPTGDQVIDQGTSINLDTSAAFEDIDGDTLAYSATGLPASLTIDTVSGLITGTLTNDDVLAGPDYAIVVTATEVGTADLFSVDESLTLTVNNLNDAPTVIAPTGNQAFDQGDAVNFDTSLAFEDVDGDTLTYSATGLPAGLSIDMVSGIVTGTLTNDDAVAGPNYSVAVTADDGNSGTVQDSFTVTVNNVNDAPTFTSTPLTAATEGTLYSYSIVAEDIDGNSIVISSSALPGWLTLTATGPGTALLSGTPNGADIGQVGITLTVNDGTVLVDQIFTITVTAAADAPVITIIGNASVTVERNTPYVDQGATASDAQDGDLTAQISVASNVDTSTVGTYAVIYSVTDSAGNLAQAQRVVVVVDLTAPVITLVGAASVTLTVGDAYVDEGATALDDVDGDITANIVTVNPVDPNTPGIYTVTYNVSDAAGNTATEVTRSVEVLADTGAPVITLVGAASITLTVGDVYNDQGATAVDDVDGDITASIVTVNPVVTTSAASFTVTYNVSDATGNAATQVTRSVAVNDPPRRRGGGASSLLTLSLLAGLAYRRRRKNLLDNH